MADVLPEKIVWYLPADAQVIVTPETNGTWSWHWVPGDSRQGKSQPGFTGRTEAIGAVRTALGEAGIILERKTGERICRNCRRPLFDHGSGRCPKER